MIGRHAAGDVVAREAVGDRPAVEQDLGLARAARRAEDQEDLLGAELRLDRRRSGSRRPRPADLPVAREGEPFGGSAQRRAGARSSAAPGADRARWPSHRRAERPGRSRACVTPGRARLGLGSGGARAELVLARLASRRADRLLGLVVRRPRRSGRSGPGPRRRSGTWRASTGCRRRSRCPVVVLDDRVLEAVLLDRVGDVAGVPLERRTRASARRRWSGRRRGTRRPRPSGRASVGCS